jgi:hypothetical protein
MQDNQFETKKDQVPWFGAGAQPFLSRNDLPCCAVDVEMIEDDIPDLDRQALGWHYEITSISSAIGECISKCRQGFVHKRVDIVCARPVLANLIVLP